MPGRAVFHREEFAQGGRDRRQTQGRCRFCKCSERRACLQGTHPVTDAPTGVCRWANRDRTLCTACVHVNRAWRRLHRMPGTEPRRTDVWRAFFRGFAAGGCDERAIDRENPYCRPGLLAAYWRRGYNAGVKELAA